jgi:hypothetical protein
VAIGQFEVDPARLSAGRQSVEVLGRLLVQARLALAGVATESPEWAIDGLLPVAVRDLLSTLDEAIRRCQHGSTSVSEALGRAATEYQQVEHKATVRHQ